MNLKPVNRHVMIAECEDPRLSEPMESKIIAPDLMGSLGFGIVLAVDETPYLHGVGETPPRLCEKDDVVYFRTDAQQTLIAENNQGRILVHESMIVAVCRGSVVVKKETKMPPKRNANPIVVPQHSLVN